MRYFVFTIVGVVVLGGVWFLGKETAQPAMVPKNSTVTINGHMLEIEVARMPEEQSRGLSGRERLPENAGMLFVYEVPSLPGFWMPGMNFGLDIIWIDENNKIVGISESVTPESYPAIFRPPSPVQYVLEVNAGWAGAHGVSVGDEVVLQ